MDIRKPILPIPGVETIPQVQASIPDRQRQSIPFRNREKKRSFSHPAPGPAEESSLLAEDGLEVDPGSRRKGQEIETVVDGINPVDDERIQGGNVDVLA
jgi:hypothetical protein